MKQQSSSFVFFKKALFIFNVVLITGITSNAQTGAKWSTGGNGIGTGDFIGTTNNFPMIFKVNNAQQMMLSTDGVLQLNNLSGTDNRLLQTDASGNITSFPMGTASQVLYGNGTWGSLPTAGIWHASGSNIYYAGGNVGIGTSAPLFPLDVTGDVRISNNLYVGGGIVISDKVNAATQVTTGKMLADSIMMDTTKAFYGVSKFKGDVQLKYKLDVTGDASINGSTNIGGTLTAPTINATTLNTTNFNVSALLSANKISAYRIAGIPGDTVIRIGDSTMWLDYGHNRIYGTSTTTGSTSYKGLGLGINSSAIGLQSLAIGTSAFASGTQSIAIGVGTSTGSAGTRSICIGAGGGLTNNIPNTMMVGFNSNIPTFFISKSPSGGTTGNVSIGGNTSPTYKLEVNDGGSGSALLLQVNNDATNSIVVSQSGTINFKVFGSGKVYAREVNVQLGTFPDYVFEKNYKLMNLQDLTNYINKNKHLPDMPSAKEVEANGGNLGELVKLQMQKIEELTLYILDQNERLKKLEMQNAILEKK